MATATATFKVVETAGDVKPRVGDVTVTPMEIRAGQRFTVSYKIHNDGNAPMTGTSKIGFTCPGAVCIRDIENNIRAVPPNGSMSARVTPTMPANATKGTYTVTVTYTTRARPGTPTTPMRPPVTTKARTTFS